MDTTRLAVAGGAPAVTQPAPAWPRYDDSEAEALVAVLRSNRWGSTSGTVVSTFETELAGYLNADYAWAISNGTLALAAALSAGGVGIGDEVIVPPYTFIATAAAALFVGAVPVFADIEPDTHLLDPEAVRAAITERTKAVIPVHLAGAVADMDAFNAIGKEHNLLIIEDCAQAIGASWKGTPVGSIGDIGTFSFQSSKNLTAGEGGAVVSNNEKYANALYSLINVGRVRGGGWYEHQRIGYNLRMTEFQGAILRTQLTRLAALQAEHEAGAKHLTAALSSVAGVTVDREDERWTSHGRHLFMMRLPCVNGDVALRDAVVRALGAEGVEGVSGGYVPLHRNEPLIRDAKAIADRLGQPYPQAHCPVADEVCNDTVWLPHHWLLAPPEQLDQLAAAIAKVVGNLDQLTTS